MMYFWWEWLFFDGSYGYGVNQKELECLKRTCITKSPDHSFCCLAGRVFIRRNCLLHCMLLVAPSRIFWASILPRQESFCLLPVYHLRLTSSPSFLGQIFQFEENVESWKIMSLNTYIQGVWMCMHVNNIYVSTRILNSFSPQNSIIVIATL